MSLNSLFGDLAARLRSAEFLLHAVHPDNPTAFTRQRKLPLPALVALMLSGMRKSIQSELDEFFAHLNNQAQLARKVSEQAFAQARAKLSLTAIPLLNDWLIERAEHYGFVPRWNALRLVAADASAVRFGLRAALADGAARDALRQAMRVLSDAEAVEGSHRAPAMCQALTEAARALGISRATVYRKLGQRG